MTTNKRSYQPPTVTVIGAVEEYTFHHQSGHTGGKGNGGSDTGGKRNL